MAPLFGSRDDRQTRTAVRRAADAGFLEEYRAQALDGGEADRGPISNAERRAAFLVWAFLAALVAAELAKAFG